MSNTLIVHTDGDVHNGGGYTDAYAGNWSNWHSSFDALIIQAGCTISDNGSGNIRITSAGSFGAAVVGLLVYCNFSATYDNGRYEITEVNADYIDIDLAYSTDIPTVDVRVGGALDNIDVAITSTTTSSDQILLVESSSPYNQTVAISLDGIQSCRIIGVRASDGHIYRRHLDMAMPVIKVMSTIPYLFRKTASGANPILYGVESDANNLTQHIISATIDMSISLVSVVFRNATGCSIISTAHTSGVCSDSEFVDNGGVCSNGVNRNALPIFTRCRFIRNTSGIFARTPQSFVGCLFADTTNIAMDGSNTLLLNCVFVNNGTDVRAGSATTTAWHCYFDGNLSRITGALGVAMNCLFSGDGTISADWTVWNGKDVGDVFIDKDNATVADRDYGLNSSAEDIGNFSLSENGLIGAYSFPVGEVSTVSGWDPFESMRVR